MTAVDVTDLDVYQLAFGLQQEAFHLSKRFPVEERYSLTDQVRRSSRSVGANICEAWRKRRYEKHFVSKLTDADGEQEETRHWVRTALACEYISDSEALRLDEKYRHVAAMLNSMIGSAEMWCHRP